MFKYDMSINYYNVSFFPKYLGIITFISTNYFCNSSWKLSADPESKVLFVFNLKFIFK